MHVYVLCIVSIYHDSTIQYNVIERAKYMRILTHILYGHTYTCIFTGDEKLKYFGTFIETRKMLKLKI